MNTNTSSDKSSQLVKVEREEAAVTRRTLLKGSAALAAAALGTHAGPSAIGASAVFGACGQVVAYCIHAQLQRPGDLLVGHLLARPEQ